MQYKQIVPVVMMALSPASALAANVYTGCSVPSLKSGYHTFYVDPLKGSPSGDGSSSRPWRTLADVLNPANKLVATQGHAGTAFNKGTDTALHPVNPSAPIKPGDLILLKSGDHGSIAITNMYNSDFITVAAAPGAVPVIDKLALVSSAKWMFQGITFQGMATAATGAKTVTASSALLVSTGYGDWEGATSDIVFDNDTFQTAASTSGWTDFDWLSKPYSYALRISGACTSVSSSHFQNVLNGIAVAAEKALIQGNVIEKFSNDAMDILASNMLVQGNTIKNGLNTLSDPWHADGIQGWSAISNGVTATNTNVTIDSNTIIKTGDPKTTYMQGISLFDGKWSNLVVQNNVVAVNTWNSIAIYGAQNAMVMNNTVVSPDPTGHPSWIQIHDAKDGTPSRGVTVRNNVATQFDIGKGTTAFDHNIAAGSITAFSGSTKSVIRSGNFGAANTVLPAVLTGFMNLNPSAGTFDVRLRPTSVAVGFGSATDAPLLDITGKRRMTPIDVGAYAH